MKHHCKCGFEKHLSHFRFKRAGIIGVVLMGLHLLFHVVECLVLPSILLSFGGHLHDESASALDQTTSEVMAVETEAPTSDDARGEINFSFAESLILYHPLNL